MLDRFFAGRLLNSERLGFMQIQEDFWVAGVIPCLVFLVDLIEERFGLSFSFSYLLCSQLTTKV